MTLDPMTVYERGLAQPEALTGDERLVYLLMDVEACMDMEGWDHFFMTDNIRYYQELKHGLHVIGDSDSLEVIEDYEEHLRANGVAMEPDAIASWLRNQDDEYLQGCRDWREDYAKLTGTRWDKVKGYLHRRDIELVG